MDLTWTTETRKVKDLKPYPHNPRKMSKDDARQLMASIEKFNYVELVAINLDDTIIAGHMRINALKKLGRGKDEIEVRTPSRMLSEEEVKEYLIRSNRNQGEWDWEALANTFDPHDLFSWGFTAEELTDSALDIKDEIEEEKENAICPACGQKIKHKD